jgi:undecaprenyl-diphosphatase
MILELNTQLFVWFSQFQFTGDSLVADSPIFFLPLFLVTAWLYYTFYNKNNDGRVKLLHVFYGCVFGVILSYTIKLFIDIDRPELYAKEATNLLLSSLPEKSFPSEHANVSMAFTTGLFLVGWKKVASIFLPFALVMNLCRIIVGVHWPADIFVGTLLGIIAAVIFFGYISQLKLVKKLDSFIIKIMKIIKLY